MKYRLIIISIIFLAINSCIEDYVPKITQKDISKYVVYGNITDKEGYHTIYVSKTTETELPIYTPVEGCEVTISDDNGNYFLAHETDKGEYKVWISQEYLNVGTKYKVDITTPDNIDISSDFETMYAGAIVDSVYYIKEDLPTNDKEIFEEGIQFYTDMTGSENSSRYFKYLVKETWEYHSPYPRQAYFDGALHYIIPEDSSRMTCWKTVIVKNIFTLSTDNLSDNSYVKYPLHYVKNTTERLVYGYSLLVEIHAFSESAYHFHQEIGENNYNREGLFEKQPALIEGNLRNLTNTEDEVLGYFFVSSVSSKRIFIQNVEDLEIYYNDMCNPKRIIRSLWSIPRGSRPCYILLTENGIPASWVNDPCCDCTSRGGTTIKPDYWPL